MQSIQLRSFKICIILPTENTYQKLQRAKTTKVREDTIRWHITFLWSDPVIYEASGWCLQYYFSDSVTKLYHKFINGHNSVKKHAKDMSIRLSHPIKISRKYVKLQTNSFSDRWIDEILRNIWSSVQNQAPTTRWVS